MGLAGRVEWLLVQQLERLGRDDLPHSNALILSYQFPTPTV